MEGPVSCCIEPIGRSIFGSGDPFLQADFGAGRHVVCSLSPFRFSLVGRVCPSCPSRVWEFQVSKRRQITGLLVTCHGLWNFSRGLFLLFQLILKLQRADTSARISFSGTHRWPKMARWIIPQAAAVQPQVQMLSRLNTTILAQSPKVHLIVWVSQHLLLPRHLLLRQHPPLHQNPLQPPVSASDIWPFRISHLIDILAAWKICIYNSLLQ